MAEVFPCVQHSSSQGTGWAAPLLPAPPRARGSTRVMGQAAVQHTQVTAQGPATWCLPVSDVLRKQRGVLEQEGGLYENPSADLARNKSCSATP